MGLIEGLGPSGLIILYTVPCAPLLPQRAGIGRILGRSRKCSGTGEGHPRSACCKAKKPEKCSQSDIQAPQNSNMSVRLKLDAEAAGPASWSTGAASQDRGSCHVEGLRDVADFAVSAQRFMAFSLRPFRFEFGRAKYCQCQLNLFPPSQIKPLTISNWRKRR